MNYFERIHKEERLGLLFNPTTYLTNSSLSDINPEQKGSPKKFLNYFTGKKEFNSKAYDLGSIVHKYTESPDEFIVADFDLPAGMKKPLIEILKINGLKHDVELSDDVMVNYAEQAGYKKERNKADTGWNRVPKLDENDRKYLKYLYDSEGKTALTKEQKDQIIHIKDSLNANKLIRQYLFEDKIYIGNQEYVENVHFKRRNELAIYWNEEIAGTVIYRKALIDNVLFFPTLNIIIKIDTKTTSDSIYNIGSTEERKGWFEYYNYDRQIAYYDQALINLYLNPTAIGVTREGQKIKPSGTLPKIYNYIVAVETKDLYQSGLAQIDQSCLLIGERKVVNLLNRAAWHISNDKWDFSKEEYDNAKMLKVDYKNINRLK